MSVTEMHPNHGYTPPTLNSFEKKIESAWGHDPYVVESTLMGWLCSIVEKNGSTDDDKYLGEWPNALLALSHKMGERRYSPLPAVMRFRRWFKGQGFAT